MALTREIICSRAARSLPGPRGAWTQIQAESFKLSKGAHRHPGLFLNFGRCQGSTPEQTTMQGAKRMAREDQSARPAIHAACNVLAEAP
jgi:hypothetical protein